MVQLAVRIIRRWFWLLILGPVAAGLVTHYSSQDRPIFYEARALLMVGPGLDTTSPSLNDLRASGQLLETYSAIAMTRPFLESVLAAPEVDRQNAGRLQDRTEIVTNPNAQTMSIRVRDRDPEQAMIMANVIAEMLVELSPSSIEGVTEGSRENLETQIESLKVSIETSESTIERLEAEYETAVLAEQRLRYLDQISQERSRITATVRALASLYESLDQPRTNQLRLIEPAVSGKLIEPDTQLRLALSIAGGFIIALGLVFAVEYFDDTIRTPADIRELEGVPFLGAVSERKLPAVRRIDAKRRIGPGQPLETSEAYGMLAFRLRSISRTNDMKSLLMLGLPGTENAGTAALRTALAMARMGTQVVLIDADAHDPLISRLFGLISEPGITDVIDSASHSLLAPKPIVAPKAIDHIPELSVIPIGHNTASSLGFYWPDHVGDLLKHLKSRSDMVIIIASAETAYLESLALGAAVDSTVFVATQGASHHKATQERIEQARTFGLHVAGTVLLEDRRRRWSITRLVSGFSPLEVNRAPVPNWVSQPQDAQSVSR